MRRMRCSRNQNTHPRECMEIKKAYGYKSFLVEARIIDITSIPAMRSLQAPAVLAATSNPSDPFPKHDIDHHQELRANRAAKPESE